MRLRIVRSPVDICFGTKPSQAAKSRPLARRHYRWPRPWRWRPTRMPPTKKTPLRASRSRDAPVSADPEWQDRQFAAPCCQRRIPAEARQVCRPSSPLPHPKAVFALCRIRSGTSPNQAAIVRDPMPPERGSRVAPPSPMQHTAPLDASEHRACCHSGLFATKVALTLQGERGTVASEERKTIPRK